MTATERTSLRRHGEDHCTWHALDPKRVRCKITPSKIASAGVRSSPSITRAAGAGADGLEVNTDKFAKPCLRRHQPGSAPVPVGGSSWMSPTPPHPAPTFSADRPTLDVVICGGERIVARPRRQTGGHAGARPGYKKRCAGSRAARSPAIAVCAGVAVLGEPVGASIVAGLLLILAGSWLTGGGPPPHRLLSRLARRGGRSGVPPAAAASRRPPRALPASPSARRTSPWSAGSGGRTSSHPPPPCR